MPIAARTLALLALAAFPALGQGGATIRGTVVDSSARPLEGADVIVRPGNHRGHSDSAGHFSVSGISEGSYVVTARKVGYAPDRWDVKLSKNGRLDVRFVLARQVQLDTITVVAREACPEYSLNGFMCRRRAARGGLYLDFPEIDERGVLETADLFRDIPGFRVELRSSRWGIDRVAVLRTRSGCLRSLVNGRPASAANLIPRYVAELTALEVYLKPDSVPAAYQRHTWPTPDAPTSGRCSVVVYWTVWAPVTG